MQLQLLPLVLARLTRDEAALPGLGRAHGVLPEGEAYQVAAVPAVPRAVPASSPPRGPRVVEVGSLEGRPVCARAPWPPRMAEEGTSEDRPDVRKQVAKARRAIASEGRGGTRKRDGAKRSERKATAASKGFGLMDGSGLNFDRRPKGERACACDLDKSYAECCAPLHADESTASPEDLVRARYTAYCYRLPDFLMDTTDPEGSAWSSDTAAWKKALLGYCDQLVFQGLEIGSITGGGEDDDAAQVDFKARFVEKGTINLSVLCEKSLFRKAAGKWMYVDGEVNYESPGPEWEEEKRLS